MATVKGSIVDDYFRIDSSASNPFLRLGNSSSTWKVQLINNHLYFGADTNSCFRIDSSGHVGIGIGGNSRTHMLKVNGTAYITSNVAIDGTAAVGNLSSNGYVTALATSSSSDERLKNIIEHFALPVEDIAEAPIVRFTWKNNDDKAIHAGSIAQYWQEVLPESVLEVDGKLSLQYGVLALLSAISLARTVVNHEQRIARLEKELSN